MGGVVSIYVAEEEGVVDERDESQLLEVVDLRALQSVEAADGESSRQLEAGDQVEYVIGEPWRGELLPRVGRRGEGG